MKKKSLCICCMNKNIELIFEESIKYDYSTLCFWLERFVPGVTFENKIPDYKIYLKNSLVNKVSCHDNESTISGEFTDGCESFIAKYCSQIMASLINKDGYLLVNAACVSKNGLALLIVGDFWQGKSSVAFSLVDQFDYELISDNYVIIKDNYVVKGTKYISFRSENKNLVKKINCSSIMKRNNREFYEITTNNDKYKIHAVVTAHINRDDSNFHVVSKEESQWFLYGKFSKPFNGECLLFDGLIPSPILNNEEISKSIVEYVNYLLSNSNLYYLSDSLDNIIKYINNKIMVFGIEYNFAIKLTTMCPGNCACCKDRKDNFKYKDKNKTFFDITTYKKICDGIKKIGGKYICLSGGEPTIVKNLSEYIKIASNIGLNVRLNTSGFGITEEKLEEWLNLGLGQIVLSVYSLSEEQTLKTRGNLNMYERTINAAKLISNARKKYNFVFIVQSVIMKDNYYDIADIFEFAINHNADMFWPSYLEDAINLSEIRLTDDEINCFRETIIPKMKEYVNKSNRIDFNKNNAIKDIEKIYNKNYKDYVYHEHNTNCPWPGKHFTFYPDGIVDPCPGHEYFSSNSQWKIDYNNIEEFFTKENLEKNMLIQYDYCKYCPQGEHKAVRLTDMLHHEHGSNDD